MPLASRETIALDSHRPLTYETEMFGATDYGVKTPILEDFLTKETDDKPEEREDRIRTVSAREDDEIKQARPLL